MKRNIIILVAIILITVLFSFNLYGCNNNNGKLDERVKEKVSETKIEAEQSKDSSPVITDEQTKQDMKKQPSESEGQKLIESNPDSTIGNYNIEPDGNYDFIIITPVEFIDPLIALAEHKNKTGIKTKIIILESKYEKYDGKDQAEQVKYCIADYKNKSGIKYAMLVGSCSKFPIRYMKTISELPDVTSYYSPSDFYYATLFREDGSFDSWDYNANGIHGEIQGQLPGDSWNIDQVDFIPEIAVGRIPAYNIQEVQTFTNKVINYETNVYNSSWSKKGLLISHDWICNAQLTLEKIAANYFDKEQVIEIYDYIAGDKELQEKMEKDGNVTMKSTELKPNPQTIGDSINNGVGVVGYIGHGGPDGWSDVFMINDIFSLQNNNMLPVVCTLACTTCFYAPIAPYGDYIDTGGIYHQGDSVFTGDIEQPACIQTANDLESIGRFFTLMTSSGAVSYIGYSNVGHVSGAYIFEDFFKAFTQGDANLGDVFNHSMDNFRSYFIDDKSNAMASGSEYDPEYYYYTLQILFFYTLFGDPSLRISGLKK